MPKNPELPGAQPFDPPAEAQALDPMPIYALYLIVNTPL